MTDRTRNSWVVEKIFVTIEYLVRTLWVLKQYSLSVWHRIRAYGTVFDREGPFPSVWHRLRAYVTIRDHVWSFEYSSSTHRVFNIRMAPYESVCDRIRAYGTVSYRVATYPSVWNRFRSDLTSRERMWPFEYSTTVTHRIRAYVTVFERMAPYASVWGRFWPCRTVSNRVSTLWHLRSELLK